MLRIQAHKLSVQGNRMPGEMAEILVPGDLITD